MVSLQRVVGGHVVDARHDAGGEVVLAAARHAGDGDAVAQLHGLIGEVALVVISQQVAELAPAPWPSAPKSP